MIIYQDGLCMVLVLCISTYLI